MKNSIRVSWSAITVLLLGMAGVALGVNEPKGTGPCNECENTGTVGPGSINVAIPCGPLAPGSVLDYVQLVIEEETPSAMTATPQALHVDYGGYSMLSYAYSNPDQTVMMLQGGNNPVEYFFESSSCYETTPADLVSSDRLAFLSYNYQEEYHPWNNGFCELRKDNGNWWRFYGFYQEEHFLELEHVCVGGRTQTLEDMGIEVIWVREDWLDGGSIG